MAKYEIRDVVCDYGIYEDGELKLILNSRSNAEYIKAILEVDGCLPNAATVYSPVVEEMSDEECMAVFRLCCAEKNYCKTCPLNNLDGCFLHIDRRVMDIVERALKQKASSVRCDCEKQREEGASEDDEKKQIEEMAKDIFECKVAIDGIDIAFAAVHGANQKDSHFIKIAEHLVIDKGYRKQTEVAREIFEAIDAALENAIALTNEDIAEAITKEDSITVASKNGALLMIHTIKTCLKVLEKEYVGGE